MQSPLKIGIIGAGFSGTAFAANLRRLNSQRQLEIVLCDKSGRFGVGPAYSTPFQYHLLNVRAADMSAMVDDLQHFMHWLAAKKKNADYLDKQLPLADQMVPRCFYYEYLQELLQVVLGDQSFSLTPVADEVVNVHCEKNKTQLCFKHKEPILVDKVVIATGNYPPPRFPFPVANTINRIDYPWDYTAIQHIDKKAPVLIVGMGLSMIDAVLSLQQQAHEGDVFAVSRHGLLPLPHHDHGRECTLDTDVFSGSLHQISRRIRSRAAAHETQGGDWRDVITALRLHLKDQWAASHSNTKQQFLRHLLPYWNIHRHRVHAGIMQSLQQWLDKKQLHLLAGRVMHVADEAAHIKMRHTQTVQAIPVQWVINCMGPSSFINEQQPLLHALLTRRDAVLDPTRLGFAVNDVGALYNAAGQPSTLLYALGAPTRGVTWVNAVPDIRKQIDALTRHLLAMP